MKETPIFCTSCGSTLEEKDTFTSPSYDVLTGEKHPAKKMSPIRRCFDLKCWGPRWVFIADYGWERSGV